MTTLLELFRSSNGNMTWKQKQKQQKQQYLLPNEEAEARTWTTLFLSAASVLKQLNLKSKENINKSLLGRIKFRGPLLSVLRNRNNTKSLDLKSYKLILPWKNMTPTILNEFLKQKWSSHYLTLYPNRKCKDKVIW